MGLINDSKSAIILILLALSDIGSCTNLLYFFIFGKLGTKQIDLSLKINYSRMTNNCKRFNIVRVIS